MSRVPPTESARSARYSDSLDVFASTNPAFGALLVYSFVEGFASSAGCGPELVLAFLPVPIAASTAAATTFSGTNVRTGLLEWLARSPELLIELPDQIREAVPISRRALIFGLQRGVIGLDDDGRITSRRSQLMRAPRDPGGAGVARKPFTVAARLGQWCGTIGPATSIFSCLGIRP